MITGFFSPSSDSWFQIIYSMNLKSLFCTERWEPDGDFLNVISNLDLCRIFFFSSASLWYISIHRWIVCVLFATGALGEDTVLLLVLLSASSFASFSLGFVITGHSPCSVAPESTNGEWWGQTQDYLRHDVRINTVEGCLSLQGLRNMEQTWILIGFSTLGWTRRSAAQHTNGVVVPKARVTLRGESYILPSDCMWGGQKEA